MARSSSRSNRETPDDEAAPEAARWRVSASDVRRSPPGRRARWLLAVAILLEAAWIAALAAMALMRG